MLRRLFGRAEPADGSVPALEAIATGITPAFLDAAVEQPASHGRRDRDAEAGSDVVREALAQKLLGAWLQNRHQTLYPLTLNLRVLTAEQRTLVAAALAALLLLGRPAADAMAEAAALRTRFAGLGADPATLGAFDAALASTPPLHDLLERARVLDVSIYVYLAGLLASDPRFPASVRMCDVLQARFDLSAAIVRSAVRRYRR